MSKKFSILFILISITAILLSIPVSSNQVINVAQNLSYEQSGQISKIKSVNYLNQDPKSGIFVANLLPDGFVLIAGDDASYPVLGFDFSNNWTGENIPIQLQDYINSWTRQLQNIEINRLQADNTIRAEWQRLSIDPSGFIPSRNDRAVAPLISTTWGQGTYYNALCPSGVPVGCVATAMSQIMKYWAFPTVGQGSHSYTPASHPSYGLQTANFGTTTYNWSGMPLSVSSSNTSVATICYHAGVAVDMDYDPTGSGAYSTDVPDALINYFKYKNTAQYKLRSAYSESAWNTLMVGELDNHRPVYYAGDGPAGGHAFILDGYTGTNYFHLNWGWDGWYNGYFYLSNLNPGGDTFNNTQDAVIGIQPSETLTTLSEGFEGTTFPPTDWTVTASTFTRSATAFITGAYSARYNPSVLGANCSGKQLRTPKLTVNASSAPITFKAKRGVNDRGEKIKVGYNTTGSGTYTYLTTFTITNTAATYTQAVTSLTPGSYYFVFETLSAHTGTTAKLWIIDDVTGPTKWVDPSPIAAINISSWNAGSIAPGTASTSGTIFQLSNVGLSNLTITSITDLSATEYSSTFNTGVSLVNGQIHEFGFTYEPLNYNTDNLTFQIVTNGGTINITLEGAGVNFQYPEGFETYSDFSLSCAPWSQYDGDLGTTYTIQDETFTNQGYRGSFIIFNPSSANPALTTGYETHGGSKYAACMAALTASAPNNDWLISPPMSLTTSGSLSFWAKSVTADYGLERFKVLYSTTTNAVSSFTNYLAGSAATYIEAPITWTNYTYTLPQTAKYFAIQCVSNDAFMFMVDDITAPNSDAPVLEFGNINGYVYRSGTSTPIVNALITAGSKTAYTNASGFYQINNLTVGTYSVSCNASGQFYFTATTNVTVTVGNTTAQNYNLTWAEIATNPTTLSASVYSTETYDQNLAISNPGGTANLQYAMWLSAASRSNQHNNQTSKSLSNSSSPDAIKFTPNITVNNDRATGWMGYTDWDTADTYLIAATTNREKSTKFYISDFGMWSNGVTISKLRALFYNPTDEAWGTATNFYFKIYGASGTGTALYTSPTYTAVSLTTMEDVLATPLLVTTDFWISVFCVTSGGKPHLVGSSGSYGNSYYGTSSAAWTAVTDFDWCLDAYVTGDQWITASQYSGTVAPAATQNVTMHFDSNSLAAGTKTAYLNIANNANYNSPSGRGDLMVIPVSLTVTVPSVPFVTLNTTTWDVNTVTGTPVSSGSVFQIKNVGVGNLTITSATGLAGTPFTTTFSSAVVLTLGQTHNFGFTYTPTGPGVHTATFTIVTNGGTKTITISAYTVGTDYLTENFAGTLFPPAGWLSYDVDADGYNWYSFGLAGIAHSDTTVAGSASFMNDRNENSRNGTRPALTPDNWLVTPRLAVGSTGVLAYWIAAQDPLWPAENYSVMVSTTNNQVASFTTELFTETLEDGDWHLRKLNLNAYANQNIYLAFRHHGCTDMYIMKLDDVQMPPLAAPLQYGNIGGTVRRMVSNQVVAGANIDIAGRTATTDINGVYSLTSIVAEMYQLTCTKTGYQDTTMTVTIPTNSTLTQNIYMDWGDAVPNQTNFTETQNVDQTISYPVSFDNPGTAPLAWETGSGVWGGDTVLGAALEEDFESFSYTSWEGWLGIASEVYEGYGYEGGTTSNAFVFESEHCNTAQWLITPLLNVHSGDYLTFQYKQFNNTGERLEVRLSTTTADTTAFTTLLTNLGPLSNTTWNRFDIDLSSYAGTDIHIAFHYTKTNTPLAYMFVDMVTGPTAYISPENWLAASELSGTLAAGGTQNMNLNVNTTGMIPGNYTAQTWLFTDGVTYPVKLFMDLTVTNLQDADIPDNVKLRREDLGNLNVSLNWDQSANAVRYHLYASAEPHSFTPNAQITTTTGTSAVITPAQLTTAGITGDNIFFRVTADNEARRRTVSYSRNHSGMPELSKIHKLHNARKPLLRRM